MWLWMLCYEAVQQIAENGQRWEAYFLARQAADKRGKPLLNVGCPRIFPGKYPCGDVCLDIDAARLAVCKSDYPVLGDVRSIPYSGGYFGAALVSHVLEHLVAPADVAVALVELQRVADEVYIVGPSKASFLAWVHPEHRLWVSSQNGALMVEQR